jgi:transglutaminase-like putative cysteine protease
MIRSLVFAALVTYAVAAPRPAAARPGDVVRSFASPARTPTGLAFDGKSLWVADRRTATIYEVDPRDGAVRSQLPAPGWQPEGLAWDGKALWAADAGDRKLYRVDPRRRLVLQALDSPGKSPRGLAWDGKSLWVADDQRHEIIAVSPVDGTELRTFKVPLEDVRGLAFDGRYLWVGDRVLDRIYLVDPQRGDVIFWVPTPGPFVEGLAWDGGARKLWAVDYQTLTIYQLVADDGTRSARFGGTDHLVDITQEVRNLGPGALRDVSAVIALPSTRDGQEVKSIAYDGTPTFVTDNQGQKLARFTAARLPAGQRFMPTMRVLARLYEVQWYLFPDKVGPLGEVPADVRQRYLGDDPKYQLKDPFIRKSAAEAVGGERNPYWMARKLARYIDDRMHYAMVGGWDAAPTVLKRGSGSCSEYTFVFIAMARSLGLPARWVGAVRLRKGDQAYRDEAFHRWAEVYLPRFGWVPWDVQHADRPRPAEHAEPLGRLDDLGVVTTVSGGFSNELTWSYNIDARYTCEERCQVVLPEGYADWSPATAAPRGFVPPPLPAAPRTPVPRLSR